MAKAQRTINPLHFEDLEPHRFEDLVRQLAHGYRPWRYLDATGKLGRDEGIDIRGIELVSAGRVPEYPSGDEDSEAADDPLPVSEEREWRISCKRYQELGPTKMREVVGETLTDPDNPPYGYVLAAACDVSAETMAAFREESFARGVSEAHLWTKAHLEDMLFRPGNDHLLFAYFGISLTARRRSQLQRIRERIATKRKLMRAAQLESITQRSHRDVLVRDVADTSYPDRSSIPDFRSLSCPPWHPVSVEEIGVSGLVVERCSYLGWVREDGAWDTLEDSRMLPHGIGYDYWQEDNDERTNRQDPWKTWQGIPDNERKTIRVLGLVPYDFIMEVDLMGDVLNEGPHVFCRFDGEIGPYVVTNTGEVEIFVTAEASHMPERQLRPRDRQPLFASSGVEQLAAER